MNRDETDRVMRAAANAAAEAMPRQFNGRCEEVPPTRDGIIKAIGAGVGAGLAALAPPLIVTPPAHPKSTSVESFVRMVRDTERVFRSLRTGEPAEETAHDGETDDEMLDRLRAMSAPDQQTWDLSPNDQAAIAWAVDTIESALNEDRRDSYPPDWGSE